MKYCVELWASEPRQMIWDGDGYKFVAAAMIDAMEIAYDIEHARNLGFDILIKDEQGNELEEFNG